MFYPGFLVQKHMFFQYLYHNIFSMQFDAATKAIPFILLKSVEKVRIYVWLLKSIFTKE